MIVFSIAVLIGKYGVAEGGFVRRTPNSSERRASAPPERILDGDLPDATTPINVSQTGNSGVPQPYGREDVRVTSDPATLVKSYHVGEYRDVVQEHYRDNFSTAPTHITWDHVKLAKLPVESVEESVTSPTGFAELLSASGVEIEKSDEMGSRDVALDEVDSRNLTEYVGASGDERGWVSKACFYVGDSASRQVVPDINAYPDLANVCNYRLIQDKGGSTFNRCCVCPKMIKAVRSGMHSNLLGIFGTSQNHQREFCREKLGKGWIHEGGLCLTSGTIIKAMFTLGLGKGC